MNWHQALDTQMDQYKWQAHEAGEYYTREFFFHYFQRFGERTLQNEIDAEKMVHNLRSCLWRADTMYVTSDMQHLLMQAAHDLPEEAAFDDRTLITPYGFCLFEETMYGEDRHGRTIALSAMAWHTAPLIGPYSEEELEEGPQQIIAVYFFSDTSDLIDEGNQANVSYMKEQGIPIGPLAVCHFFPALSGKTIPPVPDLEIVPEARGAEIIINMLKLFVAMNLLAQQPIGTPMKMRPDRGTRKRFNRSFPDEPERLITLITLRRKSVQKDNHEPQKVEWSRRWVVRGFWRRQWYPKAKRHDWKYIHEYIKGPEDKPLVITERRVFDFRR